jgi:hypothetical protein
MVTAVKEQAVEMINQMSDDMVVDIIGYLQGLAQKQSGDGALNRKTPVLGCARGLCKYKVC